VDGRAQARGLHPSGLRPSLDIRYLTLTRSTKSVGAPVSTLAVQRLSGREARGHADAIRRIDAPWD
jgi:hypothetical protein